MIYHAFQKLNIGEVIHLNFSKFKVLSRKEFATIKTLTMYEYKLEEVNDENQD